MEGKSDKMDAEQENTAESEQMECDEVLSGSEVTETTEITDSSSRATSSKKPERFPIASESTSGIEVGSRSTTSASEIPCEAVKVSVVAEKVGTASTGVSPPAKKTLLSNIKGFFSPPKDQKTHKERVGSSKSRTSRSKSISPSEKTTRAVVSDISNVVVEEACVMSEGEEENLKKGSEKPGVIKSLRRHLSKMITRTKSSTASDSANLMSDEEIERTEAATTVAKPPEIQTEIAEADEGACKLQWTENRQSLTEKPSLDLTTMTDVPSTCSGGDVFSSDASSKHSGTEEEAVAGSLASSPDEKPSDLQKDKDAERECPEKDCPSVEEEQNVARAEKGSDELSCSEKNAEMEESKDDENPETTN